jgi:hypothetical protein
MSNVPLGREEFLEIVSRLREAGDDKLAGEIEAIVFKRLFRKITKGRAPVTSVQMDGIVARRIMYIHRVYPEMSTQKIAEMVGVNPGRVSEAIAGKW